MNLRVLISAPYFIPVLDRFRPIFQEHLIEPIVADVRERLSERELLGLVGEIDGVICGDDRFTARVIQRAAPRLKVISKWGTGIDSIDLEAAAEHEVQVRNTPDAFTEAVADTVMAYVLCFARRLPWLDRSIKAGRWEKLPGRALHEYSLGVVGVGNIGKAVLRRAKAFGMAMLGNDIVEIPASFVREVGLSVVDLQDLLRQVDFVSLNCDLNSTSYHLMDRQRLSLMKTGAVLINTARGDVIDERALIEALRSGHLGGAALDVFEQEPLPHDSHLRDMDNVMLAPHNANSSLAAWERVHNNTIRNLFEGLGLSLVSDQAFD